MSSAIPNSQKLPPHSSHESLRLFDKTETGGIFGSRLTNLRSARGSAYGPGRKDLL